MRGRDQGVADQAARPGLLGEGHQEAVAGRLVEGSRSRLQPAKLARPSNLSCGASGEERSEDRRHGWSGRARPGAAEASPDESSAASLAKGWGAGEGQVLASG
jgi:hypothetical protein